MPWTPDLNLLRETDLQKKGGGETSRKRWPLSRRAQARRYRGMESGGGGGGVGGYPYVEKPGDMEIRKKNVKKKGKILWGKKILKV